MVGARILVLDIETSPNLAYVWALWQQNVALNQLKNVGQVISFAAKWHGEKGPLEFESAYDFDAGELTDLAQMGMVARAHRLLDEADAVVHWNGTSFDMPHLHREFVLLGMAPPAPYKNIDLLTTARKQFKFASNKLDHVAQQLGVGAKLSHTGFDLWRKCMDGDPKAWNIMRRYNKRDVVITDKVYDHLKPWVVSHPHVGLFTADPETNRCGRCGSEKLQRRGYSTTSVGRFQRFQCQGCGGWARGGRREASVDLRSA